MVKYINFVLILFVKFKNVLYKHKDSHIFSIETVPFQI